MIVVQLYQADMLLAPYILESSNCPMVWTY
jgi:hypothetical protein